MLLHSLQRIIHSAYMPSNMPHSCRSPNIQPAACSRATSSRCQVLGQQVQSSPMCLMCWLQATRTARATGVPWSCLMRYSNMG